MEKNKELLLFLVIMMMERTSFLFLCPCIAFTCHEEEADLVHPKNKESAASTASVSVLSRYTRESGLKEENMFTLNAFAFLAGHVSTFIFS